MHLGRVVVGMSGGVDSAMSAWLLKKKGYDVHGVYMINWDQQEEGTSQCNRTKDEGDARKMCDRLRIPFETANFVKEYWNEVFVNLLENYRRGRTVVPDIACNRTIKFDYLHRFAFEKLNADYVATGHYASTSNGDYQEGESEELHLLSGIDPIKDQSYFLSTLSQNQLNKAIFPLGSMNKSTVRQIAKDQGWMDVAEKAESMGICFVGKRKDFSSFLDEYIDPRPGRIVHKASGRVLGEHSGVHHFTVGKRLPIQGTHLGLFVEEIDWKQSIVFACEGSHNPSLYSTQFVVRVPEWISKNPLASPFPVQFRIQRTHPTLPCEIEQMNENEMKVNTKKIPVRAVAPGQMCVFYSGRICLGGGEVERVLTTLQN